MNNKIIAGILAVVLSLSTLTAVAAKKHVKVQKGGDPVALVFVQNKLRQLYPKTHFSSIKSTPIEGIFEVVMGPNTAYVDASGRYFMFGHLFDMVKQKDLTGPIAQEAGRQEVARIDFNKLPVKDAFVRVKGNGARKLAVFSDPDCPFCHKLEQELTKVDNVTIYTFLYPLASLHPDATRKAVAIWCSPDKVKTWDDWMLNGKEIPKATCDNPIARNEALGNSFNINGTPTLIAADGRMMPGALPAERIEMFLNGK